MLDSLTACSGLWTLKPKPTVQYSVASTWASLHANGMYHCSPLPMAGHALRRWEQSWEGAGNRIKLLADLNQDSDLRQSGLHSVMQFSSSFFPLLSVWALTHNQKHYHREGPEVLSSQGCWQHSLPAALWPGEPMDSQQECGSISPISWLLSSMANIQLGTEHRGYL